MCDAPHTLEQQLIVLLQDQIVELRAQITLKDKQIGQQGKTIRAFQQQARAAPAPPKC